MASNGYSHSFQHSIPHTKEKDLPTGANWVVQKYGGTSVGKFAPAIANIVESSLKFQRVAVVCSARSNNTKLEGTTNRLLRAAKEAEESRNRGYVTIVQAIEDDHIDAAKSTIKNSEIVAKYAAEVQRECQSLIKILESAQHLEEVTFRSENKIISKGEKLACLFMAAVLEDRGIPSQYVDLSDIIKKYDIPTANDEYYQQLAAAFGQEMANCGDRVPVVTGYFGQIPGGIVQLVGRGYSDLAAALVAVGIKASELQIWKEVDGIFTADPRKAPTARLISSVTPAEAAELTFYGSEVLHPWTMARAVEAAIPIRIKDVMNPRGPGTVIYPDPEDENDPAKNGDVLKPKLFRTRSSSMLDTRFKPKRPTAVTIKPSIVVINVHSNKRTRAHGFLARIFTILDKNKLSVDLISSSEVHVSMALHSERGLLSSTPVNGPSEGNDSGPGTPLPEEEIKIQDERLRGAVEDLAELGQVDIADNMAIISLVGKDLRYYTGISGRFFSVLGDNNINIEMISQGASEINISCVIYAKDASRALNVVHTNLFQFLE